MDLGLALNKHRYNAGRVERYLYWMTHGTYHSEFLTTSDGEACDGHP